MERTQIYLTEEQQNQLAALAKRSGKKQSELIREAIDALLKRNDKQKRDQALHDAAGIWKDRNDLPDYEELRASCDRQDQ